MAYILVDDFASAYPYIDQTVELLLASRDETIRWKTLFVQFGHFSGYVTSVAGTGVPPAATLDGQPYTAPYHGFFSDGRADAANLYNPKHDCYLLLQLSMLSSDLGHDDKAVYWASKALESAKASGQQMAIGLAAQRLIPQILMDNRISEALNVMVEAAAVRMATTLPIPTSQSVFMSSEDLIAITAGLGSNELEIMTYYAGVAGLIPIVFRLCYLAIIDVALVEPLALELVDAIGYARDTSANPAFWDTATQVIQNAFLLGTDADRLIELVNQQEGDEASLWKSIYLLAASLHPNCPLGNALAGQIGVLQWSSKSFAAFPSLYRLIVLPFIEAYWSLTLRRVM